ncbi:Ig-like domain-containing protein, partial [Thalassospira alkalitolerans]
SNIKYTGASNVNGDNVATYTIHANDGTVNPQVGGGNIDITAVNDAPTASGVPTDVTVIEDTASNFDLSAISFADVDGDSLTVTIAVSAGTFTASTSGSVTV